MARTSLTFTLSAPGVDALKIAVHALTDIARGGSAGETDAELALSALGEIRELLDGAPPIAQRL